MDVGDLVHTWHTFYHQHLTIKPVQANKEECKESEEYNIQEQYIVSVLQEKIILFNFLFEITKILSKTIFLTPMVDLFYFFSYFYGASFLECDSTLWYESNLWNKYIAVQFNIPLQSFLLH